MLFLNWNENMIHETQINKREKLDERKSTHKKNENYVQQPRKKWINKYLKKATIIKLHRKNVDFIRKEMNDCS